MSVVPPPCRLLSPEASLLRNLKTLFDAGEAPLELEVVLASGKQHIGRLRAVFDDGLALCDTADRLICIPLSAVDMIAQTPVSIYDRPELWEDDLQGLR